MWPLRSAFITWLGAIPKPTQPALVLPQGIVSQEKGPFLRGFPDGGKSCAAGCERYSGSLRCTTSSRVPAGKGSVARQRTTPERAAAAGRIRHRARPDEPPRDRRSVVRRGSRPAIVGAGGHARVGGSVSVLRVSPDPHLPVTSGAAGERRPECIDSGARPRCRVATGRPW